MKKLILDLLLPAALVAMMILLISASFLADDIITNYRKQYIAASSNAVDIKNSVLILDPGHGGTDGGAVSITGNKESTLNLSIALKAEQLSAFFGIKSVLTRYSEDIDYPDSCNTIHKKKVYDTQYRVDKINTYNDAVVISIHQNNFTDSSANGAQVFYRSSEDSLTLAQSITASMQNISETVRSPVQISGEVYIFKHIKCPAVMVECGFLSNYRDNEKLITDVYQNKLAMSIIAGYINSYGGINESQNSLLLY